MKLKKPTERHLHILGLYYLSGLCVTRIADRMGVTPPTVSHTISRFGKAFREELSDHHQNPKTIRGNRWDSSYP